MRSKRVGLAVGLLAGLIAIGYGLYLLGARQGAEATGPDPYRYGFVLIPVLALSGGWMIDWNGALAAVLLAAAAVLAFLAFGVSLPGLVLVALLGGMALWIATPDLF